MRWRVIGKAGLAMTLECEVFGRNAQRRGIERPMSEPGYSGGEQRDGVSWGMTSSVISLPYRHIASDLIGEIEGYVMDS